MSEVSLRIVTGNGAGVVARRARTRAAAGASATRSTTPATSSRRRRGHPDRPRDPRPDRPDRASRLARQPLPRPPPARAHPRLATLPGRRLPGADQGVAMERRRGPAEAPNEGTPATPRPAASIVLLRRGGKHAQRALEVLLLKRNRTPPSCPASGSSRAARSTPPTARAPPASAPARVRELRRRRGSRCRPRRSSSLQPLDHPRGGLAPLRRLVLPRPRPRPHAAPGRRLEIVDARWFEPAAALAAAEAGEIGLAFPTRIQLGWLAEHPTSDRRARRLPRPLDRADHAGSWSARARTPASSSPASPARAARRHREIDRPTRRPARPSRSARAASRRPRGASGNGASPACQGPGG